MNEDLREQLQKLERTLAELKIASQRALGFIETIEYKGISFNVSRRFVIADLSPLAFFHLVEHIEEEEGAAPAIARLHERLIPLLACRHQWTALQRVTDRHVLGMAGSGSDPDAGDDPVAYICRSCTAYSLGKTLPTVGRMLS